MDHRGIISKLGGIRALARKLNHPHHTTVQGWFDRDRIPVEHWADVLGCAGAEYELAAADFMPAEMCPVSQPDRAAA